MSGAYLSPNVLRPAAGAAAWLLLGVAGVAGAGWGYGLFFVSMLLLAGAAAAFALLVLTRAFDTGQLRGSAAWLGLLGAWAYLWAVGALSGHYIRETLRGTYGAASGSCSVPRPWPRWWCSTSGCTGCWWARTCRRGAATGA